MTKKLIMEGYLGFTKKTLAQMLYRTITDYESRICKNCKTRDDFSSICCNGESPLCTEAVEEDFGCNKFERREK